MLPAFQSSDSVLPGYPPHPLSPPPITYSHPQWDLILLRKSELKSQREKYVMDDKYPRVARAKQAQKFTDTLIERWREMLRPIDKCNEGSLLLSFVQHVHSLICSVGGVYNCTHPLYPTEGIQIISFIPTATTQ